MFPLWFCANGPLPPAVPCRCYDFLMYISHMPLSSIFTVSMARLFFSQNRGMLSSADAGASQSTLIVWPLAELLDRLLGKEQRIGANPSECVQCLVWCCSLD